MPEGLIGYVLMILCTVIVPGWFGLGVVRAMGLRATHGVRASLAYGYLVGHLLLAVVMWLWLLLGKPFPGWLFPVVATLAGTLLYVRTRTAEQPGIVRERTNWLVLVPLVLVIIPVLDAAARWNVNPLLFGDESLIWASKAKVWFSAAADERGLLLKNFVEHPDYPMWNPLMQNLSFASAGRVLHWENRLPLQAVSVALLMLMSAAMTRRSHAIVAAVVLFAFAGSTFATWSQVAGSDVLLACATLASVDALLRWRETGEQVWWRLACCAGAGMLASKNEGTLLVPVVAVAFAAHWWFAGARSKSLGQFFRRALWLLLPVATWLAHFVHNNTYELGNTLVKDTSGRGMLTRITEQFSTYAPQVGQFFYEYCIDVSRSRWILPATLLAAIAVVLRQRLRCRVEPAFALLAVTWLAACGYLMVFIGTPSDLTWHLQTACDRILIHVLPVACLSLAMMIWPKQAR